MGGSPARTRSRCTVMLLSIEGDRKSRGNALTYKILGHLLNLALSTISNDKKSVEGVVMLCRNAGVHVGTTFAKRSWHDPAACCPKSLAAMPVT